MSLFPAYAVEKTQESNETQQSTEHQWLTNPSFIALPDTGSDIQKEEEVNFVKEFVIKDNGDRTDEHKKEKRRKKKKSKGKKKNRKKPTESQHIPIEFTGDEEYYVDKNPLRGYLKVETLHKPACPRYYKAISRVIGYDKKYYKQNKKRYFAKAIADKTCFSEGSYKNYLDEEEYSQKTKEFNRKLAQNPKDVNTWIEYVDHQDRAPIKATKTQLAEKKMEVIEKALVHNNGNELLYKLYIQIVDSTYPSFEVSKFLDKLISKDPTSYVLWVAQILATQGSMARCIVPNVLKLYEQCMQKMYRKSQEDEIMLKLFTNCALFLRQSGLSEQFFALIRLALELNVSVDKFAQMQPDEKDQQTLIEFEEVILKSGLPMNEIWLRIEKLRENYNFLPCPADSICSDPQRIVFNEDICYFIFPLSHKENSFPLTVIILKLLKIPFSTGTSLTNRFLFKSENVNEFDSIEDLLAVCLHETTSLLSNSSNFDLTLYELVKEMVSGPSFLNTNIGYEIYMNTALDILLLCAECFTFDERKRTIFVITWLKFQRILLILEKFSSKLTNDFTKKIKSKVKNLLKRSENRNILNFYTEYALLECEFGNLHVAENIFVTSINESNMQVQKSDYCHAHVTYAEILLKEGNYNKALKVLTCFALDISLEELESEILSEPRKLVALKKLTERLNDLVFIEKNVKIMEIEQHFLPDYFVSLLKARIYYQILLKSKLEAMAFLENLLRHFIEKNYRHQYIRENIYELYLQIMQWPDKISRISNLLIYETASHAISEFPENLYILRTCATLNGQPWYKILSLLMKSNTVVGVMFLICSARYRYMEYRSGLPGEDVLCYLSSDIDANEITHHIRVANILKSAVDKSSPLRKNSLLWRLYFRSLADMKKSFEITKNALYGALDECPWNKALYMDGSVFVPQELSQIQDLIIEKQLRIYALPEELEILRNDTFEAPNM